MEPVTGRGGRRRRSMRWAESLVAAGLGDIHVGLTLPAGMLEAGMTIYNALPEHQGACSAVEGTRTAWPVIALGRETRMADTAQFISAQPLRWRMADRRLSERAALKLARAAIKRTPEDGGERGGPSGADGRDPAAADGQGIWVCGCGGGWERIGGRHCSVLRCQGLGGGVSWERSMPLDEGKRT